MLIRFSLTLFKLLFAEKLLFLGVHEKVGIEILNGWFRLVLRRLPGVHGLGMLYWGGLRWRLDFL